LKENGIGMNAIHYHHRLSRLIVMEDGKRGRRGKGGRRILHRVLPPALSVLG
jgi:hypothetical protein